MPGAIDTEVAKGVSTAPNTMFVFKGTIDANLVGLHALLIWVKIVIVLLATFDCAISGHNIALLLDLAWHLGLDALDAGLVTMLLLEREPRLQQEQALTLVFAFAHLLLRILVHVAGLAESKRQE